MTLQPYRAEGDDASRPHGVRDPSLTLRMTLQHCLAEGNDASQPRGVRDPSLTLRMTKWKFNLFLQQMNFMCQFIMLIMIIDVKKAI
jgi:hypothetical protein